MLCAKNLSIEFSSYGLGLKRQTIQAIRSLDIKIDAGEVVAVVGQSGAGKSLLAHALLGLLPANARLSGTLSFKGLLLTPERIKRLRGREIALIPQSVTYLNPLIHVGTQISRAARLSGVRPERSHLAALDALRRYHLDEVVARRFPFQLSGGMARRILTATATVGGADLILADEPTNGLDRDRASETLTHLRQLADSGKGVLLITHDIESAIAVSDRVTVFYGGVTVEDARATDFNGTGHLRHPYSRALWNALPGQGFTPLPLSETAVKNGGMAKSHDITKPNSSVIEASGCPFKTVCPECQDQCHETLPEMRYRNGGQVRCFHA